ncbi:hypothetical protein K1719_002943 [Acacia pycnantha]|nr:hypothetical protein K1719_002943 [Acacia pycnantha]
MIIHTTTEAKSQLAVALSLRSQLVVALSLSSSTASAGTTCATILTQAILIEGRNYSYSAILRRRCHYRGNLITVSSFRCDGASSSVCSCDVATATQKRTSLEALRYCFLLDPSIITDVAQCEAELF